MKFENLNKCDWQSTPTISALGGKGAGGWTAVSLSAACVVEFKARLRDLVKLSKQGESLLFSVVLAIAPVLIGRLMATVLNNTKYIIDAQ